MGVIPSSIFRFEALMPQFLCALEGSSHLLEDLLRGLLTFPPDIKAAHKLF